MDPVNNIGQIMQVLRKQMSENLEKLRQAGKLSTQETAFPLELKQPTRTTSRQTIARKITSIDADDPKFFEKATDIFVESVLLSEFGGGRINDPVFRDLVHQVRTTMISDPGIASALRQLAHELHAEGAAKS